MKNLMISVSYELEKLAARFLVWRLRTWGHCDTKDYVDDPEYTAEALLSGYGRCGVCMADDVATQLHELYVLDPDDFSVQSKFGSN